MVRFQLFYELQKAGGLPSAVQWLRLRPCTAGGAVRVHLGRPFICTVGSRAPLGPSVVPGLSRAGVAERDRRSTQQE